MNSNYIIHRNLPQGTPQWFSLRAAKITGSPISELISKKAAKPEKEKVSKELKSYLEKLEQKPKEIQPQQKTYEYAINAANLALWKRRISEEERLNSPLSTFLDETETKAMRAGKVLEDDAFDYLKESCEIEYFNFWQKVGFIENTLAKLGISPDAVQIYMDKIIAGAEIKCPQSIDTYLNILACKNGNDLMEYNFKWYCQIQFNMYVCELSEWTFLAYTKGTFTQKKREPNKYLQNVQFQVYKDEAIFRIFDELKEIFKR